MSEWMEIAASVTARKSALFGFARVCLPVSLSLSLSLSHTHTHTQRHIIRPVVISSLPSRRAQSSDPSIGHFVPSNHIVHILLAHTNSSISYRGSFPFLVQSTSVFFYQICHLPHSQHPFATRATVTELIDTLVYFSVNSKALQFKYCLPSLTWAGELLLS